MTELWDDPLDAEAEQLVAPFVTNTDRPVFGLRNLPEVVKGALFSRYSRSDKSLRRILLDEFIAAPEARFGELLGGPAADHAGQLVAVQRAEAFYDRVLVGYGDDSVAELGGAHLACEGISNIAAKLLEDSRIGISPLEKSTRYVPFGRKVGGRYRYLREPAIAASAHTARYEAACDRLFDTYTALTEPLLAWVQARQPRDAQTSPRAYASATRAKVLDLLRGLLPLATLTNVGLFGNGRAFEYLLTKLAASEHGEARALGAMMQAELDVLIPSFVKRPKTERGQQHARYLAETRAGVAALARSRAPAAAAEQATVVRLVAFDRDAELRVVAAILFPHGEASLEDALRAAAALTPDERSRLVAAYCGERGSRFHRPGRAFEEASYTFDILADIGAYRDLQRHRMLTQERQRFTVRHGFVTPPELEEAGLAAGYRDALEAAAEAYEIIAAELPDAAQYVVPLAFRVRWRITANLRELYHLAELRSARQGHPSYRFVAQELHRHVAAAHPTLAAGMRFVDLDQYDLERLAAEQRLDAKLRARAAEGETPG